MLLSRTLCPREEFRRVVVLGGVLVFVTTGCVGTITSSAKTRESTDPTDPTGSTGGKEGTGATGGTSPTDPAYDPHFACNSSQTPTVVPSAVRRMPKVHFVNSIRDFLSLLSPANLAAAMNG